MNSWISGFPTVGVNRKSPWVWGNLDPTTHLSNNKEIGRFKTYRVQVFTNVLNRVGYVLSPLVGVIRLITAICYAISARCHPVNGDEDQAAVQNEAYKFAGRMATRALIEIAGLGLLVGLAGDLIFGWRDFKSY